MTPAAPPLEVQWLLTCPVCLATLRFSNGSAVCRGCEETFAVVDGIPVLLVEADAHKRRQAAFFDEEADDEFEIERPRGAPELYRWLLDEKFRRSVEGIEPLLAGATVVCVCAGSGMDAEFLARAGARVIAVDISLGAARRTAERAARHDLPITPVVADVERLPFATRSVDVAYVHDGLHHLESPTAGLREMARVARVAVSVTEPARAAVTAVAVRLGLALAREEAGNRVARVTPRALARELAALGFERTRARRYAMYYLHEPGRVMRALSRPSLLPLAKGAFTVANRLAGRFGNKSAVVGVRPGENGSP